MDTDRYGILYGDLWENTGLHCGECIEVLINDEWIEDRIEMSVDGKWYLVKNNLSGNQIEHLKVKL